MNNFSQFGIKAETKGFEGEKIKMLRILNREIIVHDFKLEASKVYKEIGSGKCLHLQIEMNGTKHVVFTGSCGLIDQITKVPEEGLPFKTTIIQENDRYIFT